MRSLSLVLAAVIVGTSLSASAQTSKPAAQAKTEAALRTRLIDKFPGIKVQEVTPSPIPGLYEFTADGDVMYISADGKYLVDAQIIDIDRRMNVTENKRAGERQKALASLDEKQMIIFGPATAKHTVTVFTDTDCGYCQKLHNEMAQLNKLGIRVRYLAFPRTGPGTEGWRAMEAVWCSKDRNDAMTRAKAGEAVKGEKNCGTTPIKAQYELGERLGVKGTPAIFTSSGEQIGGYVPAAQMAEMLNQPAQ